MRYLGESWQHEMIRAELAETERRRRAEAQTTVARTRPALPPPRLAETTKAPMAPETPSAPSRPRWARHGGDHPNDYRMTPEESD